MLLFKSLSTHCSLIDLGHKHCTQESHNLFLEFTLTELDKYNFTTIHRLTKIKLILLTRKDILERINTQKLSDFIQYWHNRLRIELLTPSCKLIGPEVSDYVVVDTLNHGITEVLISQCTDDVEHRRARLIKQR